MLVSKSKILVLSVTVFCVAGSFWLFPRIGQAATYEDTFTSQVIDNHHDTVKYGTISWDADVPTPTTSLVVEVRAGNATNTSDSSWDTGWNTISASGDAIQSGLDNHRYFQYRLTLGTNDLSETPEVRSVTFTRNSSALYSSGYDTEDSRNVWEDISWSEDLNGSSDVAFQVRSSDNGTDWM